MESLCSKGYGTSRIYLGLRAMMILSVLSFSDSRFGVFETFAAKGDDCARYCREKMQIMVAGGDGTGARVRQSLIQK
ncbi:hypothetical protein IGI04_030443 [Brassica rapa subsp. trilocularis]|uniref:DAGKc domain-containing protein n=1 Tax=Brassica rapa subsp. trilocularis TaxID=1813537 RepID=A0ABQ7LRK8_BRACM|nr:hypothetical protein IGI04_030443 [Brassica rapa subsp. trilocularis]